MANLPQNFLSLALGRLDKIHETARASFAGYPHAGTAYLCVVS
jgi:hypothetical protein